MTLTNVQHKRLDSLAQVRKGPMTGAKVVALALGGCPVIRDGFNRLHVLERSGFLRGWDYQTPRRLERHGSPAQRKPQAYPVTVCTVDGPKVVYPSSAAFVRSRRRAA